MGRKGYVEKILIQVSSRVEKKEFERYNSLRATVRPLYGSGSFVLSVGSSRPFKRYAENSRELSAYC